MVRVGLRTVTLAVPALGESEPLVQAEYSNPGLIPGHWTLEVHPDGSAHFKSQRGDAPRIDVRTGEARRAERRASP